MSSWHRLSLEDTTDPEKRLDVFEVPYYPLAKIVVVEDGTGIEVELSLAQIEQLIDALVIERDRLNGTAP